MISVVVSKPFPRHGCHVSVHYVPRYKDGRVLLANKDVRMTSSGNKHRLKLTSILRSDQGEYTCKMRTSAGTKSCSATLTIAEGESLNALYHTTSHHVIEHHFPIKKLNTIFPSQSLSTLDHNTSLNILHHTKHLNTFYTHQAFELHLTIQSL